MPLPETISIEKRHWAEELLQQPVLARLATANPLTLQPHVVPVWFLWDGDAVWISCFSSTRKVKDLQKNLQTAILIEPNPQSNYPIQAVLFEGKAELITQPQDFIAEMSLKIYTRYMGEEGVKAAEPQSWAVDPENRIVKLLPEKTFIW